MRAAQHLPNVGWKNIKPTKERHLGLVPTASPFKIEYFAPTNLQHLWLCHRLSGMAEGMTYLQI